MTAQSSYVGWSFPRRLVHYEKYLTLREVSAPEREAWQAALRYFVQKVTYKYKRPLLLKSPPHTGRTPYTDNYNTTVQLVALVGEDVTASAYFDGAVDGMQSAFVAAKSEADWTAFVTATEAKNWATATTLATP